MAFAKDIETSLAAIDDPYMGRTWGELKMIKNINLSAESLDIVLEVGYPFTTIQHEFNRLVAAAIAQFSLNVPTHLQLKMNIGTHTGRPDATPLPQVKNIIAVASGKGGVGKSTVALSLARSLQSLGAKVGLLDADIYGPSLPTLLKTGDQKPHIQDRNIHPLEVSGLQTMSMGYLVANKAALAWRGPMLGKALEQLLFDTKWQGLDYLIVDMPPGTGDVQLTLCQKMPVSGALVVTTPHPLALADVKRAAELFTQLQIPLLGVIENMSTHTCTHCHHADALFGEGAGAALERELNIPLLGALPLAADLQTDPLTAPIHPILQEAALRITAQLAAQVKNYRGKFPQVVVE